jgi:hypothetical protein
MASMGVLASQAGASPARPDATKSVTYSVSCNLGILGTNTLTGALTTNYTTPVKAGVATTVTGSGDLVIAKALANAGYALGARSFAGSITTLNFDSTDASPSPLNAAGSSGINIPKTPVVKNQPITLLIPSSGTISVSATAGTPGTDTTTLSNSAATVTLYNKSGAAITTIAATCNAPTKKTVVAVIKVKAA